MKHEEYRELIILASLNELDDFNKQKLSEHLRDCQDCYAEYQTMVTFNMDVSFSKPQLRNNTLLEQSRRELRNRLTVLSAGTSIWDKFKDYFILYKPALGALGLFVAGLAVGLLFAQGKNQNSGSVPGYQLLNQDNVKIGNISFIDSDPADGEISFAFDAVKSVTVRGKITDSNIQQILAHSLLNEKNDGLRLRTISTIASQKEITLRPGDKIKSALINAVKYDHNPGVRREALLTLNKLPLDQDIIDALLYVLENDTNSGLRITAVNSFDPEKLKQRDLDQQLINILQQTTREDENEYIKLRAKTVLEEVTNNETL